MAKFYSTLALIISLKIRKKNCWLSLALMVKLYNTLALNSPLKIGEGKQACGRYFNIN